MVWCEGSCNAHLIGVFSALGSSSEQCGHQYLYNMVVHWHLTCIKVVVLILNVKIAMNIAKGVCSIAVMNCSYSW
jgi:hypothetical protein